MKLYLAGPMKYYPDSNFPAFHAAAKRLREMGNNIICPAESFGGDLTLGMVDYARYDSFAILQVDGIVLLPGWGASTGACTEVVLAMWLGLKFYEYIGDDIHQVWPPSPIELFRDKHREALGIKID